MRLDEKDFWEHVETLKEQGNEKGLELWLNHGLPIYTNADDLLQKYDEKHG